MRIENGSSVLCSRTLKTGEPYEFIKAEVTLVCSFEQDEDRDEGLKELREKTMLETDKTCKMLLGIKDEDN